MANILYLGASSAGSTSLHRANAIKRLGHTVIIKDPFSEFGSDIISRWPGAIHFRTGYIFLQRKIQKWLAAELAREVIKPDLIWIDMGELFGPASLNILKRMNCPIVLYNVDDPTGKRDGQRFASLIRAISLYDLVVVVRKETASECRALGAKNVMLVCRSYDEVEHRPFKTVDEIPKEFRSDVAFIGTWMRHEKRDEFLLELISQGVPVSIWGDRWNKSPHFATLGAYWRGNALRGREYVAAMQGAKICLGLLSKGNRDLHTTRSLETPFAGGLFCAERTIEHQEMYKEGVEAVFWSDAAECARQCNMLLSNDTLREQIRAAGMLRVRSLNVGNEEVCRRILDAFLRQKTNSLDLQNQDQPEM